MIYLTSLTVKRYRRIFALIISICFIGTLLVLITKHPIWQPFSFGLSGKYSYFWTPFCDKLCIAVSICWSNSLNDTLNRNSTESIWKKSVEFDKSERLTVAYIGCGQEHWEEMLTSLKSLLMFAGCNKLQIIVFTEAELIENIHSNLKVLISLPLFERLTVTLRVESAEYPFDGNEEETMMWRKMCTTCTTLRLFYPVYGTF